MDSPRERIYLSPPDVNERDRSKLLEAFDSNWIAPLGPYVDSFEQLIARRSQVKHAAALSSGTAAIHLALKILGVEKGDRVFVSDLTFAASANPVCYLDAEPVFIDCEKESWNMDPERLAEALSEADRENRLPKAVIVVDLYGQCADFDRIRPICQRYDIPIIEDAAESLGASYRGQPAGSFGDFGIFSFNGNKIITTSGGGMLVSDREEWITKARWLASQARENVPHYEHQEVGYNYRLSNLLAGLGISQLEDLERRVTVRRAINRRYRAELAELPGFSFLREHSHGYSSHWLSCLTIDEKIAGVSRNQVIESLALENIESRPVWKPMHLQPVFQNCMNYGGSVGEKLFEEGICLPSGSTLSEEQQRTIIDIIVECVQQRRATPSAA